MPVHDKLFFVAVRQASKPVAGVVKSAALSSEGFSAVLAFVGQRMHRLRIQVTRMAEGKRQFGNISALSAERAVAAGAELLGELVVYSVSGVIVVHEWRKQKLEAAAKEAKEQAKVVQWREERLVEERKQWDDFRHLQQRITLLQEELWAVRQEQERQRDEARVEQQARARRSWWWSPSSSRG